MFRLCLPVAAVLGMSALLEAADPSAARPSPALALLRQIDQGFVEVFEKVAPSVVIIEVVKKVDDNVAEEGKSLDLFLEDEKDGRPHPNIRPDHAWKLPPQRSEGSGFFIRGDGHIITNLHVIADAEK